MKYKYVNKSWIEAKVSELNAKYNQIHLQTKERQHIEYAIHYYINKLVEMDDKGWIYIEVEYYEPII